ncbi:MAG: hypothetical protein ABFQ95_04175 [Pseudomonadota bacterium]
MHPTQSDTSLTLEEVQNHFQHWRDTRTSQTAATPDALLVEARSLLGRYPQSDILHKLGLFLKQGIEAY